MSKCRQILIQGILMSAVALWTATSSAAPTMSISGPLVRLGDQLFLQHDNRLFRVTSTRTDARLTLSRLTNGDEITAHAEIDSEKAVMNIESIDFVGLKKIIGLWNTQGSSGLMNFRNYSDLNVYSLAQQNGGGGLTTTQKKFKYTVTPAAGPQWVLFLSDEMRTQMGTLDLTDGMATIQLFDGQTGAVTQTLKLHRMVK